MLELSFCLLDILSVFLRSQWRSPRIKKRKKGVLSQAQNLMLKQARQHLMAASSGILSRWKENPQKDIVVRWDTSEIGWLSKNSLVSCFIVVRNLMKKKIFIRFIWIHVRETGAPIKELGNYFLYVGTDTPTQPNCDFNRLRAHVWCHLTPNCERLCMLFKANNLPADLWCLPFLTWARVSPHHLD